MRHLLLPAIALATLPSIAFAAADVAVFYGQKQMDSDWETVDRQRALGGELFVRPDSWYIGPMVGYMQSEDSASDAGTDTDAETSELYLGLEASLSASLPVQPFIQAGLAMVDADVRFSNSLGSASDSDSATGYFLGAGLRVVLGNFEFGALVHWSKAELHSDLLDIDLNGGGTTYAGFVGLHF